MLDSAIIGNVLSIRRLVRRTDTLDVDAAVKRSTLLVTDRVCSEFSAFGASPFTAVAAVAGGLVNTKESAEAAGAGGGWVEGLTLVFSTLDAPFNSTASVGTGCRRP